MFSIGKMSPERRNASRKPPSDTPCTAAAWLGIAPPTHVPKLTTQKRKSTLPTTSGVGSPSRRSPKSVNMRPSTSRHWTIPITMPARILPSRYSWAEMRET